MLIGLFGGGRTVSAIGTRIAKLNEEQKAIRGSIEQAMADRSAAIAEIRNEMMTLEHLRQQV